MHRHTLTLLGGTHDELRVPASVLLEGMEALLEGARLATRFSVEGESVRKGARPAWLDAACALTITGLTAGSAARSSKPQPCARRTRGGSATSASARCFTRPRSTSRTGRPSISSDSPGIGRGAGPRRRRSRSRIARRLRPVRARVWRRLRGRSTGRNPRAEHASDHHLGGCAEDAAAAGRDPGSQARSSVRQS